MYMDTLVETRGWSDWVRYLSRGYPSRVYLSRGYSSRVYLSRGYPSRVYLSRGYLSLYDEGQVQS